VEEAKKGGRKKTGAKSFPNGVGVLLSIAAWWG
jgi:hypothetical protein